MKIGIIGIGVVGTATKVGMEQLGHDMLIHDIKLNTSIDDVLASELCYLSIPTPSLENGCCDVSIVEDVIKQLDERNYEGFIAIKSTVVPGTTDRLILEYPKRKIGFVPEFLRERSALSDFTDNHDICIIGTEEQKYFDLIKKSHGHYPDKFLQVKPQEAEFCKYFNNVYNATLITFANSFYEVCNAQGVNYSNVKNAIVNRCNINDAYLDCNKNFRGFSGVCLPKDTKAIDALCNEHNIDVQFFKNILAENSKYKAAIFEGMRSE